MLFITRITVKILAIKQITPTSITAIRESGGLLNPSIPPLSTAGISKPTNEPILYPSVYCLVSWVNVKLIIGSMNAKTLSAIPTSIVYSSRRFIMWCLTENTSNTHEYYIFILYYNILYVIFQLILKFLIFRQ